MSDQDNTNSGVFFRAHEDQKLSGSGKLDIDGEEFRIVVVNEKLSKDGAPMLVMYRRICPLFINDKKGNDKAPDRSGPVDTKPGWRIAAWKGEKDGRAYYSLRASPPLEDGAAGSSGQSGGIAPTPQDLDDEIPF